MEWSRMWAQRVLELWRACPLARSPDAVCTLLSTAAHHMLFTFMLPALCSSEKDYETASKDWRSYRWIVMRNPFYWAAWLVTVLLIMLGRRLHYVAGQHGPVGEPETSTEHEVRIWWIYPSDGAFTGGLCLVAGDALWYSVDSVREDKDQWTTLIISFVLYTSIITSNFLFLNAMRQRSSLHVKAFIAGNAALAFALLALLIISAVRIATGRAPASMKRAWSAHSILYILYSWVLRTGFVFFLLLMAATYFRLWFTYDPNGLRLSQVLQVDPLPNVVAEGSGAVMGTNADDTAEPRARALSANSKRRAVKYHFTSLVAAFSTSLIVFGLLIAAGYLNTESLWEALA